MAGRPRKQFDAVAALYTAARGVAERARELTPAMHLEERDTWRRNRSRQPDDPLGEAWQEVYWQTFDAMEAVEELLRAIAPKAGVTTEEIHRAMGIAATTGTDAEPEAEPTGGGNAAESAHESPI